MKWRCGMFSKKINYVFLIPLAIMGSMLVETPKILADSGDGISEVKHVTGVISQDGRADGLWSKPYGQNGAQYLGKASTFQGRSLDFTELYVDSDDGTTWVKFSDGNTNYWVDSAGTSFKNKNAESVFSYSNNIPNVKFISTNPQDLIWTKPFETKGAKSLASVKDHLGDVFKVKRVLVDKNHTGWVNIDYNGVDAYVAESAVGGSNYNDNISKETKYVDYTNKHISTTISATDKDSALTLPYGDPKSQILKPLSDFNNQKVEVLASYDNGVAWLKVKTQANDVFWMAKSASTDANTNMFYTHTGIGDLYAKISDPNPEAGLFSKPNGESGAKQVGKISTLNGQLLKVTEMAVSPTSADIWYQVQSKDGSKSYWIYKSDLDVHKGDESNMTPSSDIVHSGITVSSMNTDKSMYNPGDVVKISMAVKNENDYQFKGTYKVTISNPLASSNSGYAYNSVVKTGSYDLKGKGETNIDVNWVSDRENYRGYIATLEMYDIGGRVVSRKTTGIDVSSDWTKFPRYAALTNFSDNSQTNDDNVIKNIDVLNKYHINAAMYYDVYYRPQNPFPDAKFKTWIGDEIDTGLIKKSIDAQHAHGQSALLYDMINATTGKASDSDANMSDSDLFGTKTKADGTQMVDSRMGIFRTNDRVNTSDQGDGKANTYDLKGDQQTFNMLGTFNDRDDVDHKVQSYYNPYSKDWQNYIGNIMESAMEKLGFDGWQGDTIGDQEKVVSYENRGTNKDAFNVSTGYGAFANAMKDGPLKNKKFGINSVGGQGQKSLDESKADFQYSEMWPWDWDDNTVPGNTNSAHDTYGALSRVVDNTMRTSKQSLIVPAYMYRQWSKSGDTSISKTFNDNAILLKDASIFAAGGDSMEMSDAGHQLYTEYYPDGRKDNKISMSEALGDPDNGKLRNIYDFATAYENFLRDGNLQRTDNHIEIWNGDGVGQGQNLAVKNNSDVGKIMAMTKSGHSGAINDAETINLINFTGVDNINWQVNNHLDESQKQVKEQKSLWVKYYPDEGRDVNNIWISSPDEKYQSTNQQLDFSKHVDDNGKTYITFKVPSLEIWDLIYMK